MSRTLREFQQHSVQPSFRCSSAVREENEIMKTDNVVIEAKGITKRFEEFEAVRDVDVTVYEGEIFGFLGPNGAGKTTTIRMLTTITPPSSGTISIDGHDIVTSAINAKRAIGISQQHISLDKEISVRDNIRHHAMLHKIPKKEIVKRIEEIGGMMGLDPFLDREVEELSGGWKRKASIISSMIHYPKVLFLDEPTAGLDTQSRHMLWDFIRELNNTGMTIFLTTHYIEEAEDLCDRVAIMNKGKIVATDSPKELCRSIGSSTVEIMNNRRKASMHFPDRASAKEFIGTLSEDTPATLRRTTLEDVFLKLTGEGLE